MPPQASDSTTGELDDLAFQIFKERVAKGPVKRTGEAEAINSYRLAEGFIAARKKIKSGEVKTKAPDGPQLADCCAPNLPATHPLNLVAREYTDRKTGVKTTGDLQRVNRILAWLNANPTPKEDPEDLVIRLAHQFRELGWDLPTINVARAVFPAYQMKN